LRGLDIKEANHVWCTDITYLRLPYGFVYLVAVMDCLKPQSQMRSIFEFKPLKQP